VAVLRLHRKGRGHALRAAWSTSSAPVVAYMDVDLSTSLTALLPLVTPLLSGHRDVAIGTRLARGAHVVRGPQRELISRAYNRIVRVALRGTFSDAQCGFKALRREAALELLPLVQDDEWFFDTELLVTAQRLGMRISEVPVDWVDDPDSRVRVLPTALSDLRGIWRISHGPGRRVSGRRRPSLDQATSDQLLRFAGVGAISTLAYLLLFVAWRPLLGPFNANVVSLAICTTCNTAVHKELAHNLHGPALTGRFATLAAGLFLINFTLTATALTVFHLRVAGSLPLMLGVLVAANAVAAVLRFAVLRAWVFRPRPSGVPVPL
jgi:Glycosyl transferase family 2